MPIYSNVTLVSEGGDVSVVVYLPQSLQKPHEETFYYGSRFDHSSMIGSITRKDSATGQKHVLYGTTIWRQPHNSHWPESGVGIASEFGVGDNGAFCFYRCGWDQANDVTNGVLGYIEAKNGEPFLKIGVGKLVKGTCPTCDSTGDYKFNSPYLFYEQPEWNIQTYGNAGVRLQHEAKHHNYGYRIVKEISLVRDTLSVTTSLTNLGTEAFSTAWYSHNFFTCDRDAVGPGYSLEMNLRGDREPIYEEPGTWSWSTPLSSYASIHKDPKSIRVDMFRALEPGVRIKTEFVNDEQTDGSFQIDACESTLHSSIPEIAQARQQRQQQQQQEQQGIPFSVNSNNNGDLSMYAYNLYIERGTFSPEPQILMHLQPGASSTWTQKLVIGPSPTTNSELLTSPALRAAAGVPQHNKLFSVQSVFGGVWLVLVASIVVSLGWVQRSYTRQVRRRQYHSIPNTDEAAVTEDDDDEYDSTSDRGDCSSSSCSSSSSSSRDDATSSSCSSSRI